MMNYFTRFSRSLYFALLAYALVSACAADPARAWLAGRWQAYEIVEEDRPLQVETGEIQLELMENGRYGFTGTLNYREAGTYTVKNGIFLLTRDTLKLGAPEKAVEILSISGDTLILLMMEGSAKRILRMARMEEQTIN
jgi:hypothetical protein